ncbi:MAG: hypothetical protein J0I31_03240 [Rhizobiales bacterium]|nr:hypothetical protein [Hyphomicrobiales bacterium]
MAARGRIDLAQHVEAARREFEMAVAFHEAWKPAAYDAELQGRLDHTYAANTFNSIRAALRREMILALMRLWDTDSRTLNMEAIARSLQNKQTLAELSVRATPLGELREVIRASVEARAREVVDLISAYIHGGAKLDVRKNLNDLRNNHLAHKNISEARVLGSTYSDDEVEAFYVDNSRIVQLLMSVVLATSYNPADVAGVHKHYASLFWDGVKGEHTEGHPRFRPRALTPSSDGTSG